MHKLLQYLPVAVWGFLVCLCVGYLVSDVRHGQPIEVMGVIMLALLLGIGAWVVWYGKHQ